jgi:WD40-like Beta Propeller Repeat
VTVRSFVLLACAAGAVTAAAVLAPSALPARLDSSTPIAYSDLNGDLFVNTVSAGGESPVFQNDGSASMGALSISPDGKQVLALSSGDDVQLVLVPAAGGTPVPIAGTVGAQDGSISPDGKSAVFSIAPGGSDTLDAGIYTVPVGGGTPKSIVATPDNATDSLPVLSPDQTQVAFVRDGVDSNGDEVVAVEMQPVAGGTVRQLATDVSASLYNGGRLSFSADGKTIAYAGAFDNPGIFTVSVASGTVAQLTSDTDYWPNFLPDGSAIAFSRDASSSNADDNQDDPVAPAESDTDELWTMQVDGTSPTVVAEGDFETLALAPPPSKASSSSGGGGTTGGGGGTTGGGGGTTGGGGGTTGGGGTSTGGGTSHAKSATAISVAVRAPHYTVTWKGKAPSWKVTLHVGKKLLTAKVAGAKHSHMFTLRGAKGTVSATVKSAG